MSKYIERTLASKPTFGDYVTLPMKCYGGPNEHFVHEVLSSPFISNSWREVPIKAGYFEEQLHDTSEPVIAVRTQGVNPRDAHIFAVRLADVLPMKGTNWSWRESPLRSRIAELEMKIRHNALWQASEDAEERAHLEKLVPDLKKRIAELEEKQRWIPVSERLPQIGVRVLFYNNFIKNIHKGWCSGDEWVSDIGVFYNGDKLKRITHWMPLPESPNDLSSMTPIENSFYSYAELTEEQKIRFSAYQVFDMPKKASSNIKDTEWLSSDEVQE